jgi:hypothetical protein
VCAWGWVLEDDESGKYSTVPALVEQRELEVLQVLLAGDTQFGKSSR